MNDVEEDARTADTDGLFPRSGTQPSPRAQTEPMAAQERLKQFLQRHKTKIKVVLSILVIGVIGAAVMAIFVHPNQDAECREEMPPPDHGKMKCGKSPPYYKCEFSCDEGYGIRGKNSVTCKHGKWEDPPPVCEKMCYPPDIPSNGQINPECRNKMEFEDSKCTFWCLHNHILKGEKEITCEDNGKWSHDSPECVCRECMTGEECRDSKSWHNVSELLKNQDYDHGRIVQVDYATKEFFCRSAFLNTYRWNGICEEHLDGGKSTSCLNRPTAVDAATMAAASLIRIKMKDTFNQYEEPCDSKDMPPSC